MITKNKRCSESLEGCKMDGWITLHRKFQDWEWYTAPNHSFLFIHLLMKANHKSGKWRGHNYKRGDVLTSLSKLAEETHLSKQNIRTILKNFASTGEVNTLPNTKLTHLSICKYDTYQSKGKEANTPTNTELTQSQHSPNTELTTNNNETTKQLNNIKADIGADKSTTTKTIQDREKEFYVKLGLEWKSKMPDMSKEEVRKFYEYWTEHGDNDKKMRFEKEKTFGISRRLKTWNNNNFGGGDKPQTEPQMWIK